MLTKAKGQTVSGMGGDFVKYREGLLLLNPVHALSPEQEDDKGESPINVVVN